MIADIAFHDLDSNNPHAHVTLPLKTVNAAGFGKKDRSWNDKKMMFQWHESWATMLNSYLEAAGCEERIDHRSLRTQCADALTQAEEAFSTEEKAFWLAKATETNRSAMQHVHRAKWNVRKHSYNDLLNKPYVIVKLKRLRRSIRHSMSYHWRSLLMSEALRSLFFQNPKKSLSLASLQQKNMDRLCPLPQAEDLPKNLTAIPIRLVKLVWQERELLFRLLQNQVNLLN